MRRSPSPSYIRHMSNNAASRGASLCGDKGHNLLKARIFARVRYMKKFFAPHPHSRPKRRCPSAALPMSETEPPSAPSSESGENALPPVHEPRAFSVLRQKNRRRVRCAPLTFRRHTGKKRQDSDLLFPFKTRPVHKIARLYEPPGRPYNTNRRGNRARCARRAFEQTRKGEDRL